MALKNMFQAMRKEGYITRPLDEFLLKEANKDNDRAINVNAPSCAGRCNRANYYMRKQYQSDGTVDPRTLRIFNNGDHVHVRLQTYLEEMGMLICDELPLINEEYNIQGHTDGFLDLDDLEEVAILEIKSINDNQFQQLKDAKSEHKQQGLVYVFCAEERRKYLHKTYPTKEEFRKSQPEREEYFKSKYQHLKGGRKHSKEEKIQHQVDLHLIEDDVLYDTHKPVTKVIFLYENKNNQELKEYCVERNTTTENILTETLERFTDLNDFVEREELPPREGTKSSQTCRWCNFKNQCFIV